MEECRKDRERAQRREHLLEAAERVFARKPFHDATMQEVAAEAQIGMQGLYEHFRSKQELYEQLVLNRAKEFQQLADGALAGLADPIEQLRALARAYYEAFRERPMFLPMFLLERVHYDWGFESRFGARIHEIYSRERTRLRSVVERAVREGRLQPLPVDFLTQLCLDVVSASLSYHHRYAHDEEVETCVNRALESLLNGIGARP